MKMLKHLAAAALITSVLAGPFAGLAADQNTGSKIKSYTLKTCIVSDEKLGEMGKPYVFTNDNREIKLCCKSCLKDFKKDPAKYIKKIEEAEAKTRK
jgi:hypothetical protein